MNKKKKIFVNDNLVEIWEWINSNNEHIYIKDFLQMCKDYDIYEECYLNWHIIKDLIKERNVIIDSNDVLKNL